MATLTVWKFDSAAGADRALEALQSLEGQRLLDLIDGAVVTFPLGAKKPRTRQLHTTPSKAALGGAFWGLLFGLIFVFPLFGIAIGAGLGSLMASMADVGVSDDFIKQVREQVTPGTSALFLYTQKVQEGVLDEIAATSRQRPVLIRSNLSQDQEARLREVFGEEAPSVGAYNEAAMKPTE
jgi:uncharacterized membrane protein